MHDGWRHDPETYAMPVYVRAERAEGWVKQWLTSAAARRLLRRLADRFERTYPGLIVLEAQLWYDFPPQPPFDWMLVGHRQEPKLVRKVRVGFRIVPCSRPEDHARHLHQMGLDKHRFPPYLFLATRPPEYRLNSSYTEEPRGFRPCAPSPRKYPSAYGLPMNEQDERTTSR